jgi:hypothetical protein
MSARRHGQLVEWHFAKLCDQMKAHRLQTLFCKETAVWWSTTAGRGPRHRSALLTLIIEAAQARLALYSEGVQCEGDDVVLADEHRHLDELALVEVCGEHRPGVIGDAGVGVELVDGAEHCALQLGPSLRLGAALDPGDLLVGDSHLARQDDVLSPLVLCAAEPAGAEDGKLAETRRKDPVDRQGDGEGHPLAEEVGMPYEGVEGVASGAGADAIDKQAGLGIALPRRQGVDTRG